MKTIRTKLSLVLALATLFTLSSCRKRNNNTGGGNIGDQVKTTKFTVTVTGGTGKSLNIQVGGANTSGATSTWKMNGTVMNDAVIMLDESDFPGTGAKTYTFELQQPANNVSLGIFATSVDNSNYTIYYRSDINGVKKDEATATINSSSTFNKQLRYTE